MSMAAGSYMKPRLYGSLTTAISALVQACGGLEAVAKISGLSTAVIGRYVDPDQPERNMSGALIAQLEKHCGQPIVTTHMALSQGLVIDKITAPSNLPPAIVLGRITQETGALLSTAAEDVAHGHLTKANAAMVMRETDALIESLIALRHAARDVIEDGGA
ncbi:MAG: hypothetical protein ISS15_05480 [Alphaproteobacteria bacterium]|nr:hypothetical protein [Alphaproteobacteria bacterium]MBL6939428.1 hypothetical protein [Alphaproteobacteria bacterium]MBL7097091.1 hypothetical protein [Alphaproteobacteria bacterium]